MGTQAGERKWRVLSGDDDEMGERGSLVDENPQQGMHGFRGDHLVVVEDEHERRVRGRDGVDQDRRAIGAGGTLEEPAARAGDPRAQRLHGGDEVAQEAHRVVVRCVEREPGALHVAGREPAGHGHALAIARRG